MACVQANPRGESLWKLLAFLSRYAHQPLPVLMAMPITQLVQFAESVGTLMREESEAARRTTDD